MRRRGEALLALLLGLSSCESIQSRCAVDADCAGGTHCAELSGVHLCVAGPSSSNTSYTLKLSSLPVLVGRSIDVTLTETSDPPGGATQLPKVTADLDGTTVTGNEGGGDGGVFSFHFDLPAGTSDSAPLSIRAELRDDPGVHTSVTTSADVAGPRVDAPSPSPAQLDATVEVAISLEETHGGKLLAFAAASDVTPPDVSTWTELTLEGGHATFSTPASTLGPLKAISGPAKLHLLARDELGNETTQDVDLPLTRLVQAIGLSGPPIAAPAVLADGRILVAIDAVPGFLIASPGQPQPTPVPGAPGATFGPAVGDDFVYVPTTGGMLLLDPVTLDIKVGCNIPGPIGAGPALGRAGATELAVAGLQDGTYFAVRHTDQSPFCTGRPATVAGTTPGWPAVVEGNNVLHAIVEGSGGTSTILTEDLDATPAFTAKGKGGATGFGLVTLPVAIDGAKVIAAFGEQLIRLTFNADFSTTAVAESVSLGSVARGGPVIAQDDVIVPTVDGIAVLPRGTAWTSTEILPIGEVVASPVVGADGTIWVITLAGELHAVTIKNHAVADGWSDSLQAEVRYPPVLGCDGTLWVPIAKFGGGALVALRTESKGLDSSAPWPRAQHDDRNTANPATPICR